MTNSNLKFGFGFSAVNDSVKASAVEVKPQMIVRSTDGAFTLTAPAAKALGIAPGDYVMFMNNIDQIEAAIAAKNPDPEEIKYEISDFLYHVMVLMVLKDVTWDDIVKELANR